MAEPKKTIDPRLHDCFARLSKPAQRALLQHKIFSPDDLAGWTRSDVAKLHGVGPASFPVFEQALAEAGLAFKDIEPRATRRN